jgi:hypothetical protein
VLEKETELTMWKGEEGGCVDQGDRAGEYGVCRKGREQEVFGEGDRR